MPYKKTSSIFSIVAALAALAAVALATTLNSVAIASVYAQQNSAGASQPSGNATGGVQASIVPGATILGDKAFSPNPINVKVGGTVIWTNKDTTFHTVTSGTGPSDPNKGKEFDSGFSGLSALTTQGKIFSHKFMTAGEFPYFCQLHLTMVGKVVVS